MMPDEDEESWLRRSNARNWNILQVVDEVAQAHQATHSQVALAWLLKQPAVCSIIIGARTLAQLDDNLAAGQVTLADQEVARLNQVSKPDAPYPYRFLELYGTRDPNPEI
jgi:aryl-alcohol dehydrogenase-like predicted oxidoreductase